MTDTSAALTTIEAALVLLEEEQGTLSGTDGERLDDAIARMSLLSKSAINRIRLEEARAWAQHRHGAPLLGESYGTRHDSATHPSLTRLHAAGIDVINSSAEDVINAISLLNVQDENSKDGAEIINMRKDRLQQYPDDYSFGIKGRHLG